MKEDNIFEITGTENTSLELLSVSGAARVMKIGKNTLYQLISQGKIKTIALGKRVKIARSELRNFIKNESRISPAMVADSPLKFPSRDSNSLKTDYPDKDSLFNSLKSKYIKVSG